MAKYKDVGGTVTRLYNQSGTGGYLSVPNWPIQAARDGTIRVLTPKRFAEFESFLQWPKTISIDQMRQIATNLFLERFIENPVPLSDAVYPISVQSFELNKVSSTRIIKMTKSVYADQMVHHGKIRLGSVDEYMNFDHTEIGDATEGKCILVVVAPTQTNFFQFRGGLNERVFCCFSGEINNDIVTKFGYDAAVEITDPLEFSNAIGRQLKANSNYFAKCQYSDARFLIDFSDSKITNETIIDFDESIGVARAFIKPSRFSHQREFRFVWPTRKAAEGSINIQCPAITQFCKRIM